jgi:hypothetical protein
VLTNSDRKASGSYSSRCETQPLINSMIKSAQMYIRPEAHAAVTSGGSVTIPTTFRPRKP